MHPRSHASSPSVSGRRAPGRARQLTVALAGPAAQPASRADHGTGDRGHSTSGATCSERQSQATHRESTATERACVWFKSQQLRNLVSAEDTAANQTDGVLLCGAYTPEKGGQLGQRPRGGSRLGGLKEETWEAQGQLGGGRATCHGVELPFSILNKGTATLQGKISALRGKKGSSLWKRTYTVYMLY